MSKKKSYAPLIESLNGVDKYEITIGISAVLLILDTIIDVRSETAQFPDSKNKAGYEHGYILGLLRARNLLLEEIENLTEGKNA